MIQIVAARPVGHPREAALGMKGITGDDGVSQVAAGKQRWNGAQLVALLANGDLSEGGMSPGGGPEGWRFSFPAWYNSPIPRPRTQDPRMSQAEPASGHEPNLADETELIAALRRGDEATFMALVERFNGALLRVAQSYVGSWAVAEEVVQETWLGVLQGIGRFEGRSSLKTWIFRILANRARTRGVREGRSIPFADLGADADEPAVDAEQFLPAGHPYAGWWAAYPASWEGVPEERLLAREARERIEAAIAVLPPSQRTVITLRDVEGWSAEEVRGLLEISDANQRVLLHRARAKVRSALAAYVAEGDAQ